MEQKSWITSLQTLSEEELKSRVGAQLFATLDYVRTLGKVDFCVSLKETHGNIFSTLSLLWAEAKKGDSDIYKSFVQLVLTIGKERTFDRYNPPAFLGALDAEKIAFIPYAAVSDIFYQTDFNWNVAPSNHTSKEFKQLHERIEKTLTEEKTLFHYTQDESELRTFIAENFMLGNIGISKTKIDKNNFMVVYNKWLAEVKPTISVVWDVAKKSGIIDGDFYLADLLSQENKTIREKLFVLLRNDHYELDRTLDNAGLFISKRSEFTDGQRAHKQFWNRYERPPKEDYWDYIVARRDLLVAQDIRERKGSFFTPQIWVEKSQAYLADVLGEDWQDEYYVWDCAAGTGNLLAGLTNKYNIWASTLDKADVEVMRDRIQNGANLHESHVFQFDFLNDDFSKLPQGLQDIISDENKRKKLVVYINPPYAEATSATTPTGTGKNKAGVAIDNKTYEKYRSILGKASNELYAQFLIRIYKEIPDCMVAHFATLKILSGSSFGKFRNLFLAKLEKMFIVPANTFDNVSGHFPIGFMIWDTHKKEKFVKIETDIYYTKEIKTIHCFYDDKVTHLGKKNVYSFNGNTVRLNKWLATYNDKNDSPPPIGLMSCYPPDFQNNNKFSILSQAQARYCYPITTNNLIVFCVYFAVRKCITSTWQNDRDQFLYPNDKWKQDSIFQSDCLTFTLFHRQNRITSKLGVNHWIPFTEEEVDAKDKFASNFITDFIKGKIQTDSAKNLFSKNIKPKEKSTPLVFSKEAQAVFTAGRALWKYYHAQKNINVNASFYDIRGHFQSADTSGKIYAKSKDETYNKLIKNLRECMDTLAEKIAEKVYAYEFLKG